MEYAGQKQKLCSGYSRYRTINTETYIICHQTVREENELWEESNFSIKRKENQTGLRFLHTFNAKRQ